MRPSWAQPERATWRRHPVGLPPAGKDIEYYISQAAVKVRKLGVLNPRFVGLELSQLIHNNSTKLIWEILDYHSGNIGINEGDGTYKANIHACI